MPPPTLSDTDIRRGSGSGLGRRATKSICTMTSSGLRSWRTRHATGSARRRIAFPCSLLLPTRRRSADRGLAYRPRRQHHRRTLHWLDPSGNDKAPVDRRGRLSASTCPFWRAPHNSERSRGACGVAAPGAAQIGATRRARDRLRPRRGWRRSVSGGGIRRASPRDIEIHRVLLRGSLPSGTDFRVASVGRPPSISRACVLALRCTMRRAGGPRSRGLCLVERILPFRHAVGNDSRRR